MPYSEAFGEPVTEAVERVFAGPGAAAPRDGARPAAGEELLRSSWLGGRYRRSAPAAAAPRPGHPQVVAVGPLGFIYCPEVLSAGRREELAPRLVREARVPLVLTAGEDGRVSAWNAAGKFELPGQAAEVLGAGHPFLAEAADDLARLCGHPDAGEFVICGLNLAGPSVSFVTEYGTHGGPGPEETRAWALLPWDAPRPDNGRDYLRPEDLRAAAFAALGRGTAPERARPAGGARATVRLVTYNVHGCVGLDGKLSAARIARVLVLADADVVALQELDVSRPRSGGMDQAHELARRLQMEHHFHPAWEVGGESYGNAVLSRFPLRVVRAATLPGAGRFGREQRGALWVAVDLGEGRELQIINTHLGLGVAERWQQVQALTGPEWLGSPECGNAVALCGDLNAGPDSPVYRRLLGRLRDAQLAVNGRRPGPTWFSRYPLRRIDHVLVGPGVEVRATSVPRWQIARFASNHLPLIADLEVR